MASQTNGGVVYEMDINIDDDRILNTMDDKIYGADIDRFIESARLSNNPTLERDFTGLKEALSGGNSAYKYQDINTRNGAEKGVWVQNNSIDAGQLREFVEGRAGITNSTEIFKGAGYDALYYPNNQYAMYTVINTDIVQGNTRVFEIHGDGPLPPKQPAGPVAPESKLATPVPDAPAPRNNPAELMQQGNFLSEELKNAHSAVVGRDNPALKQSFEELSEALLSDKYSKKGLIPGKDSITPAQENGFTIRDHLGNATQRMLKDGGVDDAHWGGAESWNRFKDEVIEMAGDDPDLMKKLETFEDNLVTHNQAIHGPTSLLDRTKGFMDHIPAGIGKAFGVAAGALPIIGAATVTAEAAGLERQAQSAVDAGVISPEAHNQYRAILGGHVAQGIADPTIFGGEVATQGAYNLWADQNGLTEEERLVLKPGSIADLIPEAPEQIALNQDQQSFYDFYDSLPVEVNADMPPELQSVIEMKIAIEQGREMEDMARKGKTGLASNADSIHANVLSMEERFEQQYDDLIASGGMDQALEYLGQSAPTEVAIAPSLQDQAHQYNAKPAISLGM